MKKHFLILATLVLTAVNRADDWPQWLGPARDGVWRETGILEKFPEGGPKVRWRTAIGAGFAGPAVARGRVYVMDRTLKKAEAGQANPFDRARIEGNERILCLDEETGQELWRHEYDCPYSISYAAGPRATPAVDDGKVYCLGAEGNLACLDAEKGTVLWERDFNDDYKVETPMWGFSASPLIDGGKLICLAGGTETVAAAFDKRTGKELWHSLSAKEPGYCPPVILNLQGRRELILWDPESVSALDPETGKVYWSAPWKVQSGLTISTPRSAGENRLFLTAFYNGSRMLDASGEGEPKVVWASKKVSERDTDGLHSIISTPFVEDGYIYGVCSYGQLRCLKADTGERVWESLAATTADGKPTRWANAFLVKNGSRFFLANERGDLIIARLSPSGYEEISRAHLIEPTNPGPGRDVVWSHPAFANGSVFMRNDKEIIRADLR